MAAEGLDQAGVAGGAVGDGIAHMQTGNRTRRTLEHLRRHGAGVRERDDRPVEAFAHAPGDDADDALVPTGLIDAERAAALRFPAVDQRRGLVVHVQLDLSALDVEFVESERPLAGVRQVRRQ